MRIGINAYDYEDRALAEAVIDARYLLNSVPPGKKADPVLLRYGDAITKSGWDWLAYLSTTGVYGDYQGDWVTESSALRGRGTRLKKRMEAENAWLSLYQKQEQPVHIFRLAGIYGPGRSALEKLREGVAKRIKKEGQYFSRIHVEDIAQVLHASIEAPDAGAVYNLCDDEPAPGHVVIEEAAKLLGVSPPPLVDWQQAELSEMALEFYSSNRRVSNRKIQEKLGVKLLYPTYREGLQSLLP